MACDDEEVFQFLSTLIPNAAAHLRVEPNDVQYNDLQRYCKDNCEEFFEHASKIRLLGGYASLRDSLFPVDIKAAAKMPVARAGVRETARANRQQLTLALREEAFWRRFEDISNKMFEKPIVSAPLGTKKSTKKVERELNLLLTDMHFGADLDPEYVPLRYGRVEEARRLAKVVQQVCDYKRQYRAETRLRLHLGGDIIQGQLHDLRDGDILAHQCARAIHLLEQAIARFAAEFPAGVVITCTTGNHDRFTSRHKMRATNEKSDSLSTVIYYALKKAAKNLHNVSMLIPKAAYVSYESFGAKCFGTHGDTVLNPGYPGSSVNVRALEQQINRINAALPNVEEYKLFWVGHVHVGMMLHMANGAILLTNGALIPSDEYGVSIGLFETNCGQWMWESSPGHVAGDVRFITVNSVTDKDHTLDGIIKPFEDL